MLTTNGLNYSVSTLAIGLRLLLNSNFIDYPKYPHIYKDTCNYNISVLENSNNIDRDDITNKINNKFFDFIILGSIGTDDIAFQWFLNNYKGLENYNKNELVFIFGGDRPYNMKVKSNTHNYIKNLHDKGISFVRELNYTNNEYSDLSWDNYAIQMRNDWNKKIQLADNMKIN